MFTQEQVILLRNGAEYASESESEEECDEPEESESEFVCERVLSGESSFGI